MKDYLDNSTWPAVTPLGGCDNWEFNRTVAGKKYKVAITYYDDESTPNTSVKLYEKLKKEPLIEL